MAATKCKLVWSLKTDTVQPIDQTWKGQKHKSSSIQVLSGRRIKSNRKDWISKIIKIVWNHPEGSFFLTKNVIKLMKRKSDEINLTFVSTPSTFAFSIIQISFLTFDNRKIMKNLKNWLNIVLKVKVKQ